MSITIYDILKSEKELKLDDFIVEGIPIWRIFRRYCRDKKLQNAGINRKTIQTTLYKKVCVGFRNSLLSFIDLSRLLILRKKYENVILPYPRMQKIGNLYFEKFTDPVVNNSLLIDTSCLLVFSFKNYFNNNRINANLCFHIDIVPLLVSLIIPFVLPFHIFSSFFKPINRIYSMINRYFLLQKKDLIVFHYYFLRFKILYFVWRYLLKSIGAKRLFCVVRENFKAQIVAAHELGIPVYEFQHGAVLGNTVLYSGVYNPIIDVDYFLSFGKVWCKSDFGLPVSRILNIGWAYKNIIRQYTVEGVKKNYVLIISSPHITEKIIDIAIELAKAYPTYFFDIRCHPKEGLSQKQKNMVSSIENLNIVDNTIESYIALMAYRYVIGENSSVLYEAFSIGKIVGRLDYNGLKIRKISSEDDSSFFYLKGFEDFERFVKFVPSGDRDTYYSDFNPSIMNNLPMCI